MGIITVIEYLILFVFVGYPVVMMVLDTNGKEDWEEKYGLFDPYFFMGKFKINLFYL